MQCSFSSSKTNIGIYFLDFKNDLGLNKQQENKIKQQIIILVVMELWASVQVVFDFNKKTYKRVDKTDTHVIVQ